MSDLLKYSIGVDVSKKDIHACISVIDRQQRVTVKATHGFTNDKKGFVELQKWATKHCKESLPIIFVMEATGIYYEQLAWLLYEAAHAVSVVLPNKAKKYLQGLGIKSKNDKIDSKGLSRMGAEQLLPPWKPLSKALYALRVLTRQHESLSGLRIATLNQLESIKYSRFPNKKILGQMQSLIRLLDKQMDDLKTSIRQAIGEDALLNERCEKICRIKGVGILTFATIIAETNGFALITNHRQLVSYAGYDVIENQSGNHVGKTKISKKGNSRIRRILHMPALVAVKYNEPALRNLYERVYEKSKIKMKAYVAVQKKLLVLIYSLWKKNEAYDPGYQNTSSNEEPKLLFPLPLPKAVVSVTTETTQDELPCNESPEVLFPYQQNY